MRIHLAVYFPDAQLPVLPAEITMRIEHKQNHRGMRIHLAAHIPDARLPALPAEMIHRRDL